MKRYEGTDFENITDSAVCIGKFDGIHLGHRLLVNETVRSLYPALMLTFRFEGQKSIYTDDEKEKTASELGIEHYVEVPATKEFFSMEPETFINEILCNKLGAKRLRGSGGNAPLHERSSAPFGKDERSRPAGVGSFTAIDKCYSGC